MANLAKAKAENNMDNFILAELNYLQVSLIFLDKPIFIFIDNYSDYSRKIAIYLTTLCQFPKISIKEFDAFKTKAIKFKVQDNLFFYQKNKLLLR